MAAEHLPKKRKLLSKKAATAPVLHPQREAGEPSAAVKAAEPEHRELFPNKKRKPQPALPRRDYDSAPLHTPQAKPPQVRENRKLSVLRWLVQTARQPCVPSA